MDRRQDVGQRQEPGVRGGPENKVRADTLDVRPFPTLTGGTMKLQSGPYAWGTMKVTKDSTKDVTIITIPDSQKVRVWVRRAGVATFFGGLLANRRARPGDGDGLGDERGSGRELPEAVCHPRHVVGER